MDTGIATQAAAGSIWIPAITALFGVVLGSGLTLLKEWLSQSSTAKREETAHRRQQRVALRKETLQRLEELHEAVRDSRDGVIPIKESALASYSSDKNEYINWLSIAETSLPTTSVRRASLLMDIYFSEFKEVSGFGNKFKSLMEQAVFETTAMSLERYQALESAHLSFYNSCNSVLKLISEKATQLNSEEIS